MELFITNANYQAKVLFNLFGITIFFIFLHRKADSEITTKSFDAVMICTGHLWEQFTPKIPGIDKFTGTIIHSGDYRTFHPYVGKRVVVVGCSNSGGCNYECFH